MLHGSAFDDFLKTKHSRFKSLMRTSFRQQLAITFTIGIILLALLSSISISKLTKNTLRDRFIEEGERVTKVLAEQSTLAILYQSPENAKDVVKTILAFPDVEGVGIYDYQYTPLVESEKFSPPSNYEFTWPSTLGIDYESNNAWFYVSPVYSYSDADEELSSPFMTEAPTTEVIGYIRLQFGKETLNTMAADILRHNMSVSAGLALILLLILLAVTKRITTPLKNFALIMHRAEQGEKNIRAEEKGPRDIMVMEHAFNTMMQVLEAREGQLKETRDAALESARIKGEFAANVSHELRTPLNGVLGMLELLSGMGITSKQKEYVNVAHNSAEALLLLIDDILNFARIDAGKIKLEPIDFYLQEMVDDVVELLKNQAHRKNLQIKCEIDVAIPIAIKADPGRIRQILINLIGNAIKFTEQGGIQVRIKQLHSNDSDNEKMLLNFEVEDTGIGIAEDAQNSIFEAFSQADGSTARKYGGSGLGLAISTQLIEVMGGEIGLRSKLREGSTFWFTIPVEKSVNKPVDRNEDNTEISGFRVLIVDETKTNTIAVRQLFDLSNIHNKTATSMDEALFIMDSAVNEKKSFDFIVVDEDMSKMQGQELIRAIAQNKKFSKTRIILLTDRQYGEHEAKLAGIAATLSKPVQPQKLSDAIVRLIATPKEEAIAQPATIETTTANKFNCNILIVEDNRTNQQVATGMLERLGCSTTIAADGNIALEEFSNQTFDLILMDVQMPGMDGYEATKRIRELETNHKRIPIVAMTANVQQDDIDHCLEVGMDDFVPKPLKMDVLRQAVEKWSGENKVLEQTDNIKPQSMSNMDNSAEASIDLEVLQELEANIGSGINEMLAVYLEDLPIIIGSLSESIIEENAKDIELHAHNLKGSSRNIGANKLANICKQLEDLGRSGNIECASIFLESLKNESINVEKALKEGGNETHTTRPIIQTDELQQATILIVDDDRGMRFAMRNVLERDGYKVEEASTGNQVIAMCERQIPDLILMDAMMPGINGFEACKAIRQIPGGDNTPVLIVTALEDEDSIERAFEAGATDYIPKPVHFAVLRQRISRLLNASRTEKHVRHLAYHDPLTGLPNRTTFIEKLSKLIEQPYSEGHMVAILFLDLDRFKLVNDTLGHDVGDLLLKAVAERIIRSVRNSDIVARLGGDEFTVILDDVGSADVAARIADKICQQLREPFTFMGQEIYVTTSIGISMYPSDSTNVNSLVKYADTAMFRAKEEGGRYQFYEYGMESIVAKRMEMENELRTAIDRNEFICFFQPQLDLASGKFTGMEALVRWQHPKRGLVMPGEFISLAEELGMIGEIGKCVLHHACSQLATWISQGYKPLKLAVNLSGRQLEDPGLINEVDNILRETGISPEYLELEITESVIMKHPDTVIEALYKLKQMGITLAIDDFGTGHSSLSYLTRFPVDVLKIDRSFIKDITEKPEDAVIIKGIIALAQSLDLKVVAEGAETQEQIEFLKSHNCDFVQGFFLYKPLPSGEFENEILIHEKVISISKRRSA